MTFRQWYLGIGVALAALMPLSAHADSIPNLTTGAAPGDEFKVKVTGFSTENTSTSGGVTTTDAVPLGGSGNSKNGSGQFQETTWGVGIITSVEDVTHTGTLWSSANPGGSGTNNSTFQVAYVLWGIADFNVTTPSAGNTRIENTGADVGFGTDPGGSGSYASGPAGSGKFDGLIHLDLYAIAVNGSGAQKAPCFSAGCGDATHQEIDASSRSGPGTVTGISNVGTQFASFTFLPGAKNGQFCSNATCTGAGDQPAVTLFQSINFDPATFAVDSSSRATFFARCDNTPAPTNPGPGCGQFQDSPENTFPTVDIFDPVTLEAQILGSVGLVDASGFQGPGAGTPCTAATNTPCQAGWLFENDDPILGSTPVPEPGSLALIGTALTFLGVAVHRRRKRMSA